MTPYHYTECGLDTVFIEGLPIIGDDAGETVITIPAVLQLHRAIATGLVQKPVALNGQELRFLRTEMGLTQVQLADLVHVTPLTISRWERGEVAELDRNADALIRLKAVEALGLNVKLSIDAVSEWVGEPSREPVDLIIDHTDGHYEPRFQKAA